MMHFHKPNQSPQVTGITGYESLKQLFINKKIIKTNEYGKYRYVIINSNSDKK